MKKQINVGLRLDLLALQVYGDRKLWKIIRQRNGFSLPFGPLLVPGMIILVPLR